MRFSQTTHFLDHSGDVNLFFIVSRLQNDDRRAMAGDNYSFTLCHAIKQFGQVGFCFIVKKLAVKIKKNNILQRIKYDVKSMSLRTVDIMPVMKGE